MLHLKDLIPLWDDTIIASADATLSVNKPAYDECVMQFDAPHEGSGTNFFTVIQDEDRYRLYYETWTFPHLESISVCYAESKDGLRWDRPDLGDGTNVIIPRIEDNFTVMKDPNPACPPEHRYKATMEDKVDGIKSLVIRSSADGIHFKHFGIINQGYGIDSQNTLHWDRRTQKYYCYFRENLKPEDGDTLWKETPLRTVMVTESPDCIHWSTPVPLDYRVGEIYPLYTNCISPYYYDDRYYIGLPTRYVERREWTDNYDQLSGKELRRQKYEQNKRYGLAVTDCVFMHSADHYHWHRFDEAILTPGPEYKTNWFYGDCYPAAGKMTELSPGELSFFVRQRNVENHDLIELHRYTYRKDGFASYKAGYQPCTLLTKPFTFEGVALSVNFRTSARGHLFAEVLDEAATPIPGYTSCEYFGDSLERFIRFEKPLSALQGKPIRLKFILRDGELFSLHFHK